MPAAVICHSYNHYRWLECSCKDSCMKKKKKNQSSELKEMHSLGKNWQLQNWQKLFLSFSHRNFKAGVYFLTWPCLCTYLTWKCSGYINACALSTFSFPELLQAAPTARYRAWIKTSCYIPQTTPQSATTHVFMTQSPHYNGRKITQACNALNNISFLCEMEIKRSQK